MASFVRVSEDPIDAGAFMSEAHASPAHGAVCSFLGVVRAQNHGKKVVAVSYDGFVPLAEKTLREICTEAETRWGSQTARVIHRLGQLEVGEVSVAISVSTPHRDEAYEASRYIIEQLKVRIPVWKKEHYLNGETEWLRGHALCGHHREHDHA